MKTVKVNASTSYDILIAKGLLERTGELCSTAVSPCKVCIVSDDRVAPLYLKGVNESLMRAGFDTVSFVFPNGEASKNTATLIELVEFLAENQLTRTDCLVALGGGVVGDMCGFAAAIYLRGIKFIQIPTTLLAAVDSSVGGKTAVDLVAGKNLAGAFHQPSLVICDPNTLNTLSPEIYADGCAEAVKYGVIGDRELFDRLKDGTDEQIEWIIERCVSNKRDIVEADEFESGRRALLNLGHTVGHAIEALSQFSVSHGSAVAIGTATVMRSAVALGLCPESDLCELISLLSSLGLPTKCEFCAEELARVALSDKKRKGDSITLAVPYSIGDTRLTKLPLSELEDFIRKGL